MTSKPKKLILKASFINNEKAEMNKLFILPILAIVALAVITNLGSSIIPQAITSASDTGNITGYAANWSTQTKTTWSTIPNFITLAYFLIIVGIVLFVLMSFVKGE